jgi:NAD(P)-dependent dehydrogenase (short-subunit alcohol dehydrogenase family)
VTVALVAGATRGAGRGIAVPTDHLEPEQVAELIARIDAEQGRLDVLVNDIWGGEQLAEWDTPIWEHDLQAGLRLVRLAVETHLVTSHHALPLLLREPGGLLVEVTDGTRQYNATRYRLSVFYDLAKEAVNRIAWSQAQELGPRGATALSITPGWMRSGARWNGASTSSGAVAQVYGFTDVDGTRPDAWRYIVEHRERGLPADDTGTARGRGRPYQPSVPAGPLNGPTRSCVIQPP